MLNKRDGSPYWQIDFTLRGVTVRRSSGTPDRKKAEALEEKLRREIWDKDHGVLSKTWDEGIAEWKLRKARKRSLSRDLEIFALAGRLFAGRRLDEIDDQSVARYGEILAAKTSVGNANRHLAQLRAFFNAMVEWKLRNLPLKVKLIQGEKFEPKIHLTPDKADELFKALPGHLVPIVKFALETGLRKSNVLALRYAGPGPHLDLENGIAHVPAISAKAKKPITIPLSSAALDIVRDMERSRTGYVFTDHRGHAPIGSVKTAWKASTTKAGLVGLRFHDLRHAWASWHARSGTPSLILQKLGGWSSQQMVRHYTDLNVADLRQYVK